MESCELRESTHGFFSSTTQLLEDGMVQYLSRVVPLVMSSCTLDEPRLLNITTRTALDEKAAAIQALGLFALHTKSAYAPYLQDSLGILVDHSSYFDAYVRRQAITGLKNILIAAHVVFQGQDDGACKSKEEILESVLTILIKTMNKDDDKEVVAQAGMNVSDIIKDFGYVAVETYMPLIVNSVVDLLLRKSACQQIESGSDIYDVDAGHDEVLMDALSDLLPALSKAMGSKFVPHFKKLIIPLMTFAKHSSSDHDRTMVVACFADVAQEMGAPIAEYVDKVMSLVLEELDSELSTNRRNAAFCAGELYKGGTSSLTYFNDVLESLYLLIGESEKDNAVKDNAAGAIAKMIMAKQESVSIEKPSLFSSRFFL